MNILKWVLGVFMILWAIFLSLPLCLYSLMSDSSNGSKTIFLCLAIILPLFNILGTILGNLKSPWYYLFYLPSILVPIAYWSEILLTIVAFIGFVIIPAIAM